MRARVPALLPLLLLLALPLAGCAVPPPAAAPQASYRTMGFDGTTWPDLHGAKVTILAYPWESVFKDASERFHNLTNGTAELVTEQDSGKVLERATRERGNPSFDVVYGIDNVLMGRAVRDGVFTPYEPLLGRRIDPRFGFVPGHAATPVNHGYIAVNVDPRANLTVRTLDDVRAQAAKFVTEDPRVSTPGLGFLIATVATYGEPGTGNGSYIDYWNGLFHGGALVVPDWTTAYEFHFSGGYGQGEAGSKADKPIVTSYTTSPAYEMYYGYGRLNGNVLAPKATFHQIQTMGIANGTRNPVAAQAWIEFTLTDGFQGLAASGEAIYPVVASVSSDDVYQGRDPKPGTFQDAGFTYDQLDAGVPRWLSAWTDAYERSKA